MGDFNRVLDDQEEMGAALAQAAPLTRVTEGHANPCWDGDLFIDHIFAGGAARRWLVPDSLRVQIFRETDARLKSHLSDHLPGPPSSWTLIAEPARRLSARPGTG